jgi:hypothetical protein
MNRSFLDAVPARDAQVSTWLTPRRLRAQAAVLAFCLWGVCAVDFATPGLFDRAGNVKFQDFLPLFVSARMIAQGRASQLYDNRAITRGEMQVLQRPLDVTLPALYGPQVPLLFRPLSRFSFLPAGLIWVQLSLLIYGVCVYLVLNTCANLVSYYRIAAAAAVAFPPLFHVFVRGQLSALALLCFTAAYLAFRVDRKWAAGIALGMLFFKPQFAIAIPLVLLLARSWIPLATMAATAFAQVGLAWLYFGTAVLRSYANTLWHVSDWISKAELSLAPIEMHSLRSFWQLLLPWREAELALYALSSIAVIAISASVWRSQAALAPRFAALSLAAVLVNPHLFVYDLLVLAPALLLVGDWAIHETKHSTRLLVLTDLAFLLPLIGPASRWTHVQLSVPCFVALLWALREATGTAQRHTKLAWRHSGIV